MDAPGGSRPGASGRAPRRPNEVSRLRKRFVWYKLNAFEPWPSEEADRYAALPMAHLEPLIYQSLPKVNPQFQLYATWEQAV